MNKPFEKTASGIFFVNLLKRYMLALQILFAAQLIFCASAWAQTTVALSQVPLLALKSAPGLVMLTMSRDHRLFYSAYTDNSDLNADGVIDVGFNPAITYYGYFVPTRCYAYDATNKRFSPKSVASNTNGCFSAPSSARWHGNWLNWLTTSRMDALRRVLYGGYRSIDASTVGGVTVLQGTPVPADSHVWGKEFRPPTTAGNTSTGPDTYDISYYTSLAAPTAGKQHVFMVKSDPIPTPATVTHANLLLPPPTFRIVQNVDRTTARVWNWVSNEQPVGPDTFAGTTTTNNGVNRFSIAVEACVDLGGGVGRESECQSYTTGGSTYWKPKGVLHDYATSDSLKFGLMTGSYLNNYSGGVLRKDIGTFNDEVDAKGVYKPSVKGIVYTINNIQNYGFYNSDYTCGYFYASLRNQGSCHMWGAPVAEMMYEGLRYFNAGTTSFVVPTSAYINGVAAAASPDSQLELPTLTSWANPFRPKASGGNPICSRPVQMVIADPLTSFDTDQLPGAEAKFSTTSGGAAPLTSADKTIVGLNVVTQADAIWQSEFGSTTKKFFIGQSGSVADGNPTAKSVTSFSNIRGHAPDETLSHGGYFAASVAKFGKETGISAGPGGGVPATNVTVDTISIALGSVVPPIELSYLGNKISIVPVLKTISGGGVNAFDGTGPGPAPYQETGAITGFFVDQMANTTTANINNAVNSGYPYLRFMVSFSNAGQGTDNDMDEKAFYILRIDPITKKPKVEIDLFYDGAGRISTLGYVISGTTADGLYQEVVKAGAAATDINYLDTLANQVPAPSSYPYRHNTVRLPVGVSNLASTGAVPQASREFTFGASSSTLGSYVPHDPLWYAAKYGGPRDPATGDPINYFRVTNASTLPGQMGKAFRSAAAIAAVASTSVVGVGQRSLGSAAIYQANYDSLTWTSRLYAFSVLASGVVSNSTLWEVSSKIGVPATRTKLFLGQGGNSTPLPLTSGNYSSLSAAEQTDFGNATIYEYLLGDKSNEERKGLAGTFRNRGTTAQNDAGSVLGDIVNSDPQIISKKNYGYSLGDATYSSFLATITTESLAVSANDGFFHIFDAAPTTAGGGELLGFMPQAARGSIKDLATPAYSHRFILDGSIGLGHAKLGSLISGCEATTQWCSVAVAAGGAGAQTVFAVNTTSQTYSASSVLWEINSNTTLPTAGTLGNVMGRPVIGKLNSGTWVAIFGNGYNSTVGTANLFVVNLATGAIIKEIPTNNAILNNGLGSTEIVLKSTGNKDTIEYVYSADYKGNIWRFDLSGVTSLTAGWPANAALVYTTPTGRPITAEIKIGDATGAPALLGSKMIYFGTGSYLNSSDPLVTSPRQALYGIYDDLLWTLNTSPSVAESTLVVQSLTMTASTDDVRTTSTSSTPWYLQSGKKGWVLPLSGTNVVAGERVIAPPVRYTVAGKVDSFLFTSIVPGIDDCVAGVDAWITGVDAMTGNKAIIFDGLASNSVKVVGGSPRGVFVLQDGGDPALYISQTVFSTTTPTTTYTTSVGGQQTVCINGVCGTTQVIGIKLTKSIVGATAGSRQVWRQLK
ncbi:PilC/PilY family type IV pilus protein [Rhodoferax saidenbachensis]|uniref:Type IV pilus assembly protein PilY1 n=1 Tax=Rhodoferax saidenbachensis TaxID=1484693 RepID=A0ABU1ZS94_9BURK|nr:PilC/PilY family type IV pilus protein [Rhodoferax saidenbachensis]MDR7308421.1 type IV pilus assembly protein PilY1 [Rhodoferax saidenbachensis]